MSNGMGIFWINKQYTSNITTSLTKLSIQYSLGLWQYQTTLVVSQCLVLFNNIRKSRTAFSSLRELPLVTSHDCSYPIVTVLCETKLWTCLMFWQMYYYWPIQVNTWVGIPFSIWTWSVNSLPTPILLFFSGNQYLAASAYTIFVVIMKKIIGIYLCIYKIEAVAT